jgi:hypothetical protein
MRLSNQYLGHVLDYQDLILGSVRDFSLPPMGIGGVKRLGHEADHSPPSSAEVENGGTISPLPLMSSWHSA